MLYKPQTSQKLHIGTSCRLCLRVVRPKHPLTNRQRLLIEGERFFIVLLQLMEASEIVQTFCEILVIRNQMLLTNGKDALVQRRSLLVFSLLAVEIGQAVEWMGHVKMLWSYLLL